MQEESKNKKEKWGKPKLIVLMRGDREEGVLYYCKAMNLVPGDPPSVVYGCVEAHDGVCDTTCSNLALS